MQGDENLDKFGPDQTDSGTNVVDKNRSDLIGVPYNGSPPDGGPDTGSDAEMLTDSDSGEKESCCSVCRQALSKIFLNVDGNTLIMESCDGCDIRRWQLAGKRIDLKRALEEVGEHVTRART